MEISKKQIEFYNNKINKIGKLQKIRNSIYFLKKLPLKFKKVYTIFVKN